MKIEISWQYIEIWPNWIFLAQEVGLSMAAQGWPNLHFADFELFCFFIAIVISVLPETIWCQTSIQKQWVMQINDDFT